jgi:hypothetical protein
MVKKLKKEEEARSDGTFLQSQHSRGRGRRIPSLIPVSNK